MQPGCTASFDESVLPQGPGLPADQTLCNFNSRGQAVEIASQKRDKRRVSFNAKDRQIAMAANCCRGVADVCPYVYNGGMSIFCGYDSSDFAKYPIIEFELRLVFLQH